MGFGRIKKVQEHIQARRVGLYFKVEHLALVARQSIQAELQDQLQSKADHIDVSVHHAGRGFVISVTPKDDVGLFLFKGTEPHNIVGTSMPIMTSGKKFANAVHHPGQESRYDDIMRCVIAGVAKAKVADML